MKYKILLIFFLTGTFLLAQEKKSSLAIIEINTTGIDYNKENITDVVRFEIEKSQKYNLMEVEEMEMIFAKEKHYPKNCFNQLCLVFTGKTLKVDKVLTGSVNKLGDNKLVVLKLYNVNNDRLEKSKKIEIIADDDISINTIVSKAIEEFHTNEEKFITINLSEKQQIIKEEEKVEEEKEPEAPKENVSGGVVRYYNGVPIYNGQQLKDYQPNGKPREKEVRYPKFAIITRPSTLLEFFSKANIGIQYSFDDLTAIKTSYAYMFKSTSDEVWTIYGDEPGILSGFEIRSEFLLRVPQDYFDYENMYSRMYFSFEGGYQHKYHMDAEINDWDENVGNLTYYAPGLRSKVILGNIKVGFQNVFSDRIYLDGYVGLGIRSLRYKNANDLDVELNNRTIPNFAAGFDIGILIK